jgi:hypothetical protein
LIFARFIRDNARADASTETRNRQLFRAFVSFQVDQILSISDIKDALHKVDTMAQKEKELTNWLCFGQ